MLILTRDIDQDIIINDNIKVSVLAVNGKQVRLGIEAPNDINIVREELEPDHPALDAKKEKWSA